MISNFGWILILILLLILYTVRSALGDYDTYKGSDDCYERSVFKCLHCNKRNCKYHKLADKFLS